MSCGALLHDQLSVLPPGGGYKIYHTERNGRMEPGASRHLVFMTYLNDVTDEGGTQFFHQNVTIQPKKGLACGRRTDLHAPRRFSPTQEKRIMTGWSHAEVRQAAGARPTSRERRCIIVVVRAACWQVPLEAARRTLVCLCACVFRMSAVQNLTREALCGVGPPILLAALSQLRHEIAFRSTFKVQVSYPTSPRIDCTPGAASLERRVCARIKG